MGTPCGLDCFKRSGNNRKTKLKPSQWRHFFLLSNLAGCLKFHGCSYVEQWTHMVTQGNRLSWLAYVLIMQTFGGSLPQQGDTFLVLLFL